MTEPMSDERLRILRKIIEAATYNTPQAKDAVEKTLDSIYGEVRRLRHENANARQAASSEAENCEALEKLIEGHEALMQEAHEELEGCSPNAPITDRLRTKLEKQ